jgi:hypothetical protein
MPLTEVRDVAFDAGTVLTLAAPFPRFGLGIGLHGGTRVRGVHLTSSNIIYLGEVQEKRTAYSGKNFFPKSRCSAGIDRWMAAGCAEIALALAHLPIFCGRFQVVAHRNLYQSVIQWRPCCLIYENAGSATVRPSPRKRDSVPGGARVGGTRSGWVGSSCSFWRR